MPRTCPAMVCLTLGFAALVRAASAAEPQNPPAAEAIPATWIRLTDDGHFKQRPAWSPDGRELVFTRHHQDKIWLYILDAAAGTERRLTTRDLPEYDAA